jgi:hypothetical protein
MGTEGWPPDVVVKVMLTQWALKAAVEVLFTPLTYALVGFLKRREGVDVFDSATDFTPLRAQV